MTKSRAKKAKAPSKAQSVPLKDKAAPEAEEEELEEPVFTDTGYFDDSCDVPILDLIEHVISEGKGNVDGIVEQEDGTLVRLADAEDPDVEVVEAPVKELGRGKRNRIATRLYNKDWEYTEDTPDSNDEGKRLRKKKKKKAAL